MEKTEIKRQTVTFCGDFCLAGQYLETYLNASPINPWTNLVTGTDNNSVIVANLECPITEIENGHPIKWANLKMSPRLHWLLDGLSMVILGNNHIGDFGIQGIQDTLGLLRMKNISYVGFGPTLEDALKPAFIELEGGRLGIISICCPTTNSEFIVTHQMQGVVPLGMGTLKQAITSASNQCNALVAYLHWGVEGINDPAPDQLRLARHAIDCGADAVIGCHSHTIQSYEQYKGRWIFYSLGNYLFNAGNGNKIKPDGTIEQIPIVLKPENRESLTVTFHINKGNKNQNWLCLDRIQPMRFGENWIPQPVGQDELSFDLQAANNRLKKYSRRCADYLSSREEPVFKSILRNGVLAYWYNTELIQVPSFYSLLLYKIKKLTQKCFRLAKKSKELLQSRFHVFLLNIRIMAKWMIDRRKLPLTSEHRELYDIIHRHYWHTLKDFPNLINCRDFNDRMQWLKLFDQSEEIVRCSDKVLVRDYIRERVGEKYLVKLYQVHDHFYEIDFDSLPKSFVIKANHDSGTVILVKDKLKLNFQITHSRIESALKRKYGWDNGEWAYSFIKPRVFVEEFINPEGNTAPPDYKFYCVEGVVKFIHFISDRGYETKEQIVDPKGNDMATELYPTFKLSNNFSKPKCWDEMISVAERLSKGFKCVRIDLFCFNNNIFSGEMTFWPMAGCYKGDGQKKLGKLLDFDRTTFKSPIYKQLKKTF